VSKKCKKYGSNKSVKNGFVFGVQRYKCKECATNFIDGDKRIRYGLSDRLKVLKLDLFPNSL
jgi:transposase-like protein